MADAITVQGRPIYVEDFLPGSATFAQTTDTVLGLGSGVTVTPLVIAASDAAAATAGVPLGFVYLNNGGSFTSLKTRMT